MSQETSSTLSKLQKTFFGYADSDWVYSVDLLRDQLCLDEVINMFKESHLHYVHWPLRDVYRQLITFINPEVYQDDLGLPHIKNVDGSRFIHSFKNIYYDDAMPMVLKIGIFNVFMLQVSKGIICKVDQKDCLEVMLQCIKDIRRAPQKPWCFEVCLMFILCNNEAMVLQHYGEHSETSDCYLTMKEIADANIKGKALRTIVEDHFMRCGLYRGCINNNVDQFLNDLLSQGQRSVYDQLNALLTIDRSSMSIIYQDPERFKTNFMFLVYFNSSILIEVLRHDYFLLDEERRHALIQACLMLSGVQHSQESINIIKGYVMDQYPTLKKRISTIQKEYDDVFFRDQSSSVQNQTFFENRMDQSMGSNTEQKMPSPSDGSFDLFAESERWGELVNDSNSEEENEIIALFGDHP